MSITIKTSEDLAKMRTAARVAVGVLEMIADEIKPGVTTNTLDRLADEYTVAHGAISAPYNYRGFPKHICTSVNAVVCHGIPCDKTLSKGDIINVDVTVIKDGFHADTSKTFFVGNKVPKHIQRLVSVTQECLYLGIEQVKPGACLRDIAEVIQMHAEKNHYSVVREYCGHGIGRKFHEEPSVLHYVEPGQVESVEIVPGMVFTIEPMINLGSREIKLLPDGWTVVTKDHKPSAQWEHTIAVTETGCEVLTLRPEEVGRINV